MPRRPGSYEDSPSDRPRADRDRMLEFTPPRESLNVPVAVALEQADSEYVESIVDALEEDDMRILDDVLEKGKSLKEVGIDRDRFMGAMNRQSREDWMERETLADAIRDLFPEESLDSTLDAEEPTADSGTGKDSDATKERIPGQAIPPPNKASMGNKLRDFVWTKSKDRQKKDEDKDKGDESTPPESDFQPKQIDKSETPSDRNESTGSQPLEKFANRFGRTKSRSI